MSNSVNFGGESSYHLVECEEETFKIESEFLLQSVTKPNSESTTSKDNNFDVYQDPMTSSSFAFFEESKTSEISNVHYIKDIEKCKVKDSIIFDVDHAEDFNDDQNIIFNDITIDSLPSLRRSNKIVTLNQSATQETDKTVSNFFQLIEADDEFSDQSFLEKKSKLTTDQVYTNKVVSSSISTTNQGVDKNLDIKKQKNTQSISWLGKRRIDGNEKYQLERERNNKSVKKSRKKQREKQIKVEENIKQKEQEEKEMGEEIKRLKKFIEYLNNTKKNSDEAKQMKKIVIGLCKDNLDNRS